MQRVGVLTEGANTVGGYLVGAYPRQGGLPAREMIEQPRKAYLLWNVEPDYDVANPAAVAQALLAAETVIACSVYRNGALDYADVILPITPFTETAGTFINCEGRVQSFNGTVRPAGEARPGWKVLRVLGNLLGLQGFEYETSDQVRSEAVPVDLNARLSNETSIAAAKPERAQGVAERSGENRRRSGLFQRCDSPPLTASAGNPRCEAAEGARECANVAIIWRCRCRQGCACSRAMHLLCSKSRSMNRLPTAPYMYRLLMNPRQRSARCSGRSRWNAGDGRDHHLRQSNAGVGVAGRMVTCENYGDRAANSWTGCLPDVMGAPADRLVPYSYGSESRRSTRFAAADCRCIQVAH